MDNKRSKSATIISGVLAVMLGLILITMPGLGIATVILLFSIFLILYGIIRVYESFKAPQGSSLRLPWLILGALAILGGLGLIFYPGISITLLAYYIAFYAIFIGILELTAGFRGGWSIGRELLIIIAGGLSVLFGLYLLFYPTIGTVLLFLVLGWYELIYGAILVIYGLMQKPGTTLESSY